jgi:hypothetical protein
MVTQVLEPYSAKASPGAIFCAACLNHTEMYAPEGKTTVELSGTVFRVPQTHVLGALHL